MDWFNRHRLATTLGTLALSVVLPVLVGIWLGRGPWTLLPGAIPILVFWYVLERVAVRQRKRTLQQLATTGHFECAIRWPNAIKDSLSERWAPGVGGLSAEGFGFQHGEAAREIPQRRREDRELLENLGRRELSKNEAKSLQLAGASVGVYRTKIGVLEICAAPENLAQLDVAAGEPSKPAS